MKNKTDEDIINEIKKLLPKIDLTRNYAYCNECKCLTNLNSYTFTVTSNHTEYTCCKCGSHNFDTNIISKLYEIIYYE